MLQRIYCFYVALLLAFLLSVQGPCHVQGAQYYSKQKMLELREKVRAMFQHAYEGYLRHASDYDELRPLTCDGIDTWGSYSLTLIDALDTLATMGNFTEFRRVTQLLENMDFDKDINVSVFETNIRIVGGLLSAHLLSKRAGTALEVGWPCEGPLLRLAEDVARRLLPAFDTATGMPYGTVNLRYGVPKGETTVTCTAGVGTFLVEFGTLSRLTGDPVFEEVALNAVYALWERRSSIGLFGNHIDVQTGRWTALDAGIGAGVDSYFEYLVKGAILLNRPKLLEMFHEARHAIDKYLKRDDWYVWANMNKGQVTLPVFQSLEAFWPGLLSLVGDINSAMRTLAKYSGVWRKYGFLPEFFNIPVGEASPNRESYPLRPELIESVMYLYRATKNQFLLELGEQMVETIEFSAKTRCGYATIRNVVTHEKENRMESFYLAETTKYLYLLFDESNFLHNNADSGERLQTLNGQCAVNGGAYIFNTEAHPVDMSALYCCHDMQEDIFDSLDLSLYSDATVLKNERDKRLAEEELLDQYVCRGRYEHPERPSIKQPSVTKKTEASMAVDIEVYDDDNNPAADLLVDNFERIKRERQQGGPAAGTDTEAGRKTMPANHLTVTDLDEFFVTKRENFSHAEMVLQYVMSFMRNYTLDPGFISGLQLLDKNVTAVLGTAVQKDYESRSRTLWELYELQQEHLANVNLVKQLGLLAFDEDSAMLDRVLRALNYTGVPSAEEVSFQVVLQQIALLRTDFEIALVNTTAMQGFLLKILINGTEDKKRTFTSLLNETEIAALPTTPLDDTAHQKLFSNVRRIVEFKKRMIETFDKLQALMLDGNKQLAGDETVATKTTTMRPAGELEKQPPSTEKPPAISHEAKAKDAAAIRDERTTDDAKEDVENTSMWSQLVQTILRKTTQQRAQFDEERLLQKTRKSLQHFDTVHARTTLRTARTKANYELFTCQRPRFIERFAYREFYP